MDPASGGPAQGIRNNVPFWQQQGIAPTILSFDSVGSDFKDTFSFICIGPSSTPWGYAPKAMHWLLLNLQHYDVVIIHGLWLYNGYAVTKAIKKLKHLGKQVPKVYIMPHGMLDPYFQQAPERRLKAIRNIIYWQLVEKKVINSADGVLFTCEEEMHLAATTFKGYAPKATYNVGYGIIPPPIFSNALLNAFYEKCSAVSKQPYFLFLSRIHPKKGVEILLEAYAQCYDYCMTNKHDLPDLVIAGPGMDTDYGKSLLALQQQFPSIANKVHYPSMLQGDAKWGALYGAELFVLPSHQENFGIAIVEAMACKNPVLITNKVNIWREIEQGGGGIVTDDNVPSLLSSLKGWAELSAQDKVMKGEMAYNTYQLNFTADATSKKFIEVLKNN